MAQPSDRTIAIRGIVAAVVAAIPNAGLVAVADALDVGPEMVHLEYPRVVVFTVLGVLAAAAVFAVIARRRADPGPTFVRVATIVLVVSFVPDLGVLVTDPAATPAGVAFLMLMHVVAAVAAVWILPRGVGDSL